MPEHFASLQASLGFLVAGGMVCLAMSLPESDGT
jgi:hypothetical protein